MIPFLSVRLCVSQIVCWGGEEGGRLVGGGGLVASGSREHFKLQSFLRNRKDVFVDEKEVLHSMSKPPDCNYF